MPVILAGMDHRTVWRFTGAVLEQGFLHARCCATCVLVQTVFYTVAFPQLQFITVVDDAFTLCPFHCRQARVARRHARLGPFLVVQFLDKLFSPVVVLRQVPILSIYVTAPLLEVSFVLWLLCCCCFSVLFALFLVWPSFEGRRGFALTRCLFHS